MQKSLKQKLLFIIMVFCLFLIRSPSFADNQPSFDLSVLTHDELNTLSDDISSELKLHHETNSSEEETILAVVEEKTESYYSSQGITVSWPWFDYNYTKNWDFFTVSTHLNYKDADNKKQKRDVYAELFPDDSVLTLFYLQIGEQAIINRRSDLPTTLLLDSSQRTINIRTGLDLSAMTVDELGTLQKEIKDEITAEHSTQSSVESSINELVKTEVESYYGAQGITVSWPWFDYTYTCDWGCYTETTRISYKNADNNKQDRNIYAEIFTESNTYAVYYLTIGDEILFDKRDELRDASCLLFINSRNYQTASELAQTGQYEKAITAFEALNGYSDSAEQITACETAINERAYAAAKALMDNEQYKEAIAAFEALNGCSDSAEQIAACETVISERAYAAAKALMDNEQYEEAIAAFEALNGYSDSTEQITACETAINERTYTAAKALMKDGQYEKAITAFKALNDYSDSAEQITACETAISDRAYAAAHELMDNYHYQDALTAFEALNGYLDSDTLAAACQTAIENIDRTVEVAEDDIYIYLKKKYTLKPMVTVLNDQAPKKTTFEFSSSDESIANAAKDGTITALNTGDAVITYTASDNQYIEGKVGIHVIASVSKITLSENKIALELSSVDASAGEGTLSAIIAPENAYIQTVTWSSSKESVATVDDNGVVHAVGIGKTVITSTSDDTSGSTKKATCSVTVTQAVESVTLDIPDGVLYVGKTAAVQTTVLPKNAANKKLTWSTGDDTIATVTSAGKVKGIAPGTVTITAVSANGINAEYQIEVKYAPTVLQITATAKCIAKNHVGNNWSKGFSVDDHDFSKSTKITVESGQSIALYCWIEESDTNPDIGSFSKNVEITDAILKNGLTIKDTVYVTENGGRYSGHDAEWEVVIKISPK